MTLTYEGDLGIGNTQPLARLHVTGTSRFTNQATFLDDVNVDGTFSAASLAIDLLTGTDANITGVTTSDKFVGILEATPDSNNIIPGVDSDIVSVSTLLAVGSASTTNTGSAEGAFIIGDATSRIFITDEGLIGIGTTSSQTNPDDIFTFGLFNIFAVDQTAALGGVGVGTTSLQCLVDFSSVGLARTEIGTEDDSSKMRFMLPPKLSTAERIGLSTVAGAMIYNTDLNKAQVYTGIAWEELH